MTPNLTVKQQNNFITVQQGLPAISVEQDNPDIVIQQGLPALTIQQGFPAVVFIGTLTMNSFLPFSFTAIQGQTVFGPLPAVPLAIWLYITGSAQNQSAGDFTINDLTITLSTGVNAGDTVYGVIQVQ